MREFVKLNGRIVRPIYALVTQESSGGEVQGAVRVNWAPRTDADREALEKQIKRQAGVNSWVQPEEDPATADEYMAWIWRSPDRVLAELASAKGGLPGLAGFAMCEAIEAARKKAPVDLTSAERSLIELYNHMDKAMREGLPNGN